MRILVARWKSWSMANWLENIDLIKFKRFSTSKNHLSQCTGAQPTKYHKIVCWKYFAYILSGIVVMGSYWVPYRIKVQPLFCIWLFYKEKVSTHHNIDIGSHVGISTKNAYKFHLMSWKSNFVNLFGMELSWVNHKSIHV